ncbi:hypothetical protein ES702_03984 [subsurface metagenome]
MSERKPYDRGQFNQRNKSEVEIRLDPRFDTEEATKSGHNLWKRRRLWEKGTKVGTTYTVSKIFDARFYKQKLFSIANLDGTNNLLYKIEACINPSQWHEICAESTITPANKRAFEWDDGIWAFYRVWVKSSASSVEPEVYACGMK